MYPKHAKINELLKDFQREHLHMAIVVDEYGGTSGIVTMEDVIEEVIGDIKDEFDEDQELEYRRLSDHEFIFEGKTMLIDVCRLMDVDKSSFDEIEGDANSLAGMILEPEWQDACSRTENSFSSFFFYYPFPFHPNGSNASKYRSTNENRANQFYSHASSR
jgi:Mg2+/Co2+ transporter CorB